MMIPGACSASNPLVFNDYEVRVAPLIGEYVDYYYYYTSSLVSHDIITTTCSHHKPPFTTITNQARKVMP